MPPAPATKVERQNSLLVALDRLQRVVRHKVRGGEEGLLEEALAGPLGTQRATTTNSADSTG
jgi:hypothetical protein